MALLLKRLGENVSRSNMEKTFWELDEDGDGEISLDEFMHWYTKRSSSISNSAFDVLFGPYKPHASWWFMQILWLKTAINVLFTFGYFGGFSWHLWVHLTLAASICTMSLVQPHSSFIDASIELFALICLAGVTHVASIFKAGEQWSSDYLVATAVMAALPLVVAFGLTAYMKKVAFSERSASQKLRKEGKERKKGEQDGGLKKVTGMVAKVLHKAEDGLMRKFEGAEEKLEEMVFGTDSDGESPPRATATRTV